MMYSMGETIYRTTTGWKLPVKMDCLLPFQQNFTAYTRGAYSDGLSDRESISPPHSPSPPPRTYKPCVVCGDRSSGYHYGVSSCEGCKGFFRRSVHKKVSYVCHRIQSCSITKQTRSRCQFCRFQRCLEVGMLKESVRNDQRKKRNKDQQHQLSTDKQTVSSPYYPLMLRSMAQVISQSYADIFPDNKTSIHSVKSEKMKTDKVNVDLWKEFSERSANCVTMIVDFAKKVPGFSDCSIADQITLLKAASLDILLFRLCTSYNMATDTMTFSGGWSLNRQQLRSCGFGHLTDAVYHFAQLIAPLRLDSTEIALLCAVCLISPDRSGLAEPHKIERLQEPILESLHFYTKSARLQQKQMFAKLLMTLTDLRSVSVEGSKRYASLKLEVPADTIPPLLSEMFNRY